MAGFLGLEVLPNLVACFLIEPWLSVDVAAAVVQLKLVASELSAAPFGQICHLSQSQVSYYQWAFPVLEEKITN